MIKPKKPLNDQERLEELRSYHILDSKKELEFDNLANLAADICDAPLAFISLIDEDRQWFKSKINFDAAELPRSESFCGHAILAPEEPMIIEDARKDDRFFDNQNVTKTEKPTIFYAGIPLLSANNLPLGTLCVVDHKPKKLKDFQLNALKTLAKQVEQLLELRKARIVIEKNHFSLKSQYQKLSTYQQAIDEAVIFAITDYDNKIIHANKHFKRVSGYSENELIGETLELIDSGHFDQSFWDSVETHLKSGNVWQGRVKYRNKSGDSYWVKSTIVPLIDENTNRPVEFFHIQKDISEIVKNEQERVNKIIYKHEKNKEDISHSLREGIAQSMAGLSFHLTAMESQIQSGKTIQKDSILTLKEILKDLLNETNNLAFDIMPRTLMKEGILESLQSYFGKLKKENGANIEFNPSLVKCFPIEKSAEIQVYRTIVNIFDLALKRDSRLKAKVKLFSTPLIGFYLRIEQDYILDEQKIKLIIPLLKNIEKQLALVDGIFEIHSSNNFKSFELKVMLPEEFTIHNEVEA